MDSLQVSSAFLNPQTQLLTIKRFDTKDSAMNFLNTIKEKDDLFAIIQPNKFDQFIISSANYQLLTAKKEINTYHDFFNKNFALRINLPPDMCCKKAIRIWVFQSN